MDFERVLAGNSDRTASQIKKIARWLGQKPYFPKDYEEDIEQELYLRLLKALRRFDPDQGSPEGFIYRVIENEWKKLVDGQMTQKQRNHRDSIKSGEIASPYSHPRQERICTETYIQLTGHEPSTDETTLDRRIDVAVFVADLPDELRILCNHLLTTTKSETARITKISRSTVAAKCKRLRVIAELKGLREYLD